MSAFQLTEFQFTTQYTDFSDRLLPSFPRANAKSSSHGVTARLRGLFYADQLSPHTDWNAAITGTKDFARRCLPLSTSKKYSNFYPAILSTECNFARGWKEDHRLCFALCSRMRLSFTVTVSPILDCKQSIHMMQRTATFNTDFRWCRRMGTHL